MPRRTREDDKKFHELVAVRNKADQLVHATRSALKEHGGKVPPAQIGSIESALSELEKVMKGDDKAAIESRTPGPRAGGPAAVRRGDVRRPGRRDGR